MNLRTYERTEQRRREALLDDLRAVHRRERAPASLRQQLLERFAAQPSGEGWFSRVLARQLPAGWGRSLIVMQGGSLATASLSLASCIVLALVAARLLSGDSAAVALGGKDGLGERPSLEVSPEPSGDARWGSPALAGEAAADQKPRESQIAAERPCPLFGVPSGAMIAADRTDVGGLASDLALRTLSMQTPNCGPLERRYIELVPATVGLKSRAPVLLVLHDTGRSAELMRLDSRGHFDDIARREGLVLVYANAAPGPATVVKFGNSGGWQTDKGTHFEIDDEEYLERVLSDLVVRHVIDGDNDVYLVGYGGGAMMALRAAARRPSAYAGVAAILPPKPDDIDPPVVRPWERLSRAFFMVDEKATLDVANRALIRRWAHAFGIARPTRQRHWPLAARKAPVSTVEQLDVALPASGSAAVRVLVAPDTVDPFPAGSARPTTRASAEPSPSELDAAWESWAFLSGAESIDPFEIEPDEPGLLRADGTRIRPEVVGFEDPEMVIDEEVVVVPPRPPRDVPF